MAAPMMVTIALLSVKALELTQISSVNTELKNVYRVVTDGSVLFATSMPPLGEKMYQTFPDISSFTRIRKGNKMKLTTGNSSLFTSNYLYVDPGFFEVFGIEINSGSVKSFGMNRKVILTEDFAARFGSNTKVGDEILLNDNPFEVAAIISSKSPIHLDFDFLLSMNDFSPPGFASMNNWGWLTFYTYVSLNEGADPDSIGDALPSFLAENAGPRIASAVSLSLQKAEDVYNTNRFSEDGKTRPLLMEQVLRKQLVNYGILVLVSLTLAFRTCSIKGVRLAGSILLIVPVSIALWEFSNHDSKYLKDLEQLGFDPDNFIIEMDHPDLREKYISFRSDLMDSPEIESVGGANHIMEGIFGTYRIFPERSDPSIHDGKRMNFYPVHHDFFSAMGINQPIGEKFVHSRSDTLWKLVLNQSATIKLGVEGDALGKKFFISGQGGMHGVVTGVVEDFRFDKMSRDPEPLVCFFRENAFNFCVIKPRKGQSRPALEKVNSAWTKNYGGGELNIQKHSDREDFMLGENRMARKQLLSHLIFTIGISIPLVISIFQKPTGKRS